MKISISLSQPMVADAVLALFNMRTVAHIFHLSTPSFAAHKGLNDFYDAIVELADRFAEAAIGRFGLITNWPEDLSYGLSIKTTPAAYVKQASVMLTELSVCFKEQPDLANILAESIELCNQTVYKLENLS